MLMNKYDEQNQLRDPDPHQQKLASLYQKYVANRNAAESIRNTYLAMIKILKKVQSNGIWIKLRDIYELIRCDKKNLFY